MDNFAIFQREVNSIMGGIPINRKELWGKLTDNQREAPVHSAITVSNQLIASEYDQRRIKYAHVYYKCRRCCYSWDHVGTKINVYEPCPECGTKNHPQKFGWVE